MKSSSGKRVFDMELVKGSTPDSLVRLIDDEAFEGATPDGAEFSDGFHRFVRVLPLREAAAIIKADIAAGRGVMPLTRYVERI